MFIGANAFDNHVYNNTIAGVNNGLRIGDNKANNNLFENNILQNVSQAVHMIGNNSNTARHNVIYNSSANILLPPYIVSRSVNIEKPSIHTQTISHDGERIALIEPTFTYAAYQNGSFYNFYKKHQTSERDCVKGSQFSENRPIPMDHFHIMLTPHRIQISHT